MANTVYSYTKTTWADHSTMGNQTRMNNLETSASVGLYGLNPQLSGPFVHSGITCMKDGTVANQLDIASGYAFATMADGTTGFISVVSDNTHTTSTPSSTYYLFLKNDGTWQWGTTSTGPTNSLPICQATTDGSGNISVVTDVRHNAGSPGVPIVAAHVLDQHVTSTADALPVNLSGVIQGLYRATVAGFYGNSTTGEKITVSVAYTSAHSGTPTMYFMTYGGGAPGVVGEFLNGSQTTGFTTNSDFACAPIDFYVGAGGIIRVHYIDPAGTPNDYVTVLIQRIA